MQGILYCNRVGHENKSIIGVCMKKGCAQPIPCCQFCIIKDHRNHQIEDFVKLNEMQELVQFRLQYSEQLMQTVHSFSEHILQWKQEIFQTIDNFKQNHKLTQCPTLTELNNFVQMLRDSDSRTQQEKIVQEYSNQINSIKLVLNDLKNQTNSLFQIQPQKENLVKMISTEQNLNLEKLKFKQAKQLESHSNCVEFVTISNDDTYLASSQPRPSKVYIWNLKSNKRLNQLSPQYEYVDALQFSNNNSMLAVSSSFGSEVLIEIFDQISQGIHQVKFKYQVHESSLGFSFINDSLCLISVSSDSSLRLFDFNVKKEICKQNCAYSITGLTYSTLLQFVACSDSNGQAYLFDFSTLNNVNLKLKWKAHSSQSWYIEFIKNSKVVMTSSDSETRFWLIEELLKNQFIPYKQVSEGGLTVKAYPADNPQVIITCSDWMLVKIWNYDSTNLIQSVEISCGLSVRSFAITSDFDKIITGGKNKMVNIFELSHN